MEKLELARFLADSATELLDQTGGSPADQAARAEEAAELMNLGSRILRRVDHSAQLAEAA